MLDDILHKLNDCINELYDISDELEEELTHVGDEMLEKNDVYVSDFYRLIDEIDLFKSRASRLMDVEEDDEPDWYHIKLQERLDKGE